MGGSYGTGYDPGGKVPDKNTHEGGNWHQSQKNSSYIGKSGGGGNTCFVEATPVLTSTGWKFLGDITQNDFILSYDRENNEFVERKVLKVAGGKVRRIWEIKTANHQKPIQTTWAHPFLTNRGWINCWRLREGDMFLDVEADKTLMGNNVLSLERTEVFEPTFNLITEIEHTYIIQGVIVHNFGHFKKLNSLFWRGLSEVRGDEVLS